MTHYDDVNTNYEVINTNIHPALLKPYANVHDQFVIKLLHNTETTNHVR